MSRAQRVLLLLIGFVSVSAILLGTSAGDATGWPPDLRLFLQWTLYHCFGLLYLAFMFCEQHPRPEH